MARFYSQYVEVEWSTEPMTVEELGLMHRLNKGDIEAGVSLLVSRSDNTITAVHIRGATLDSWQKWVGGMKAGIDVANAPEAARLYEARLRQVIQLPSNMRLADRFIEVVDAAPEQAPIDLSELFKGLNLGGGEQPQDDAQ